MRRSVTADVNHDGGYKMLVPYIGITDFMNSEQVQAMLRVFERHRRSGSQRKLHVGVMMSHKTLHDIPSRWQNAFPPKWMIGDIFYSNRTYNCLHYADYDDNPGLQNSIPSALMYGGVGTNALQLDMVWPNPDKIANGVYAWGDRKIEVILQVGRKALDVVQNDPKLFVDKLREYDGVIHRILLDKSGGQGRGMDAVGLLPFARAIRDNFPELGLVVAGGLGPETMHLVEPIVKEFPDVSIDAQGRLRPSGNALDPIDWDLAEVYLAKALQLLG